MSSVIYTNTAANSSHNVYNQNNRYMNTFMQRVSTGMKVNAPKDNASVYAISEKMRAQIRANDQANQNAQNDSALLKTAQGGISNTVDILKTLKERAINAANDSNLNQNRGDIATEVKQLALQIDDNAYKVKFNNRAVLNGGYDTTVGTVDGASGAAAVTNTGASTINNPTQVATHAVYNMTGLQTLKSDGTLDTVSANSAKVVDLSDTAKKSIFHSGDKITLTWNEDGAQVKKEVTLAASTDLAALATDLSSGGNLIFSFQAVGTDKLTSGDSDSYAKKVLGA